MKFRVIGVHKGRVKNKVFSVKDRAELDKKLSHLNFVAIEILPFVPKKLGISFNEELCLCFKQFVLLLDSFVPLDEVLKYCIQVQSKQISEILQKVLLGLKSGKNLSQSFEAFGDRLNPLYKTLISIGEQSGKLQEIFNIIVEDMQEKILYKKRIKKTLFYPCVVLLSIVLAFVIGVVLIIPEFRVFFEENQMLLPFITRSLLFMEYVLSHFGILIILSLVALIALLKLIYTQKTKLFFDTFLLKIPIFGRVVLFSKNQNFLQSMYFLQSCGNDFKNSLNISAKIFHNAFLEREITKVIEDLEKGLPFSRALKNTALFDSITLGLLSSGEKSGKLDLMFLNTARYYKEKSQDLLDRILLYIEPLCNFLLALLILYFALGIFLPIWSLQDMQHIF